MKKGQLKLSFGMIFSIILIIFFMAFAFYAIIKFLELKDVAQVGKFTVDLQEDIDKMWRSEQGSQPKDYSLPKKVEEVCFTNNVYDNLFFRSKYSFDPKKIKHIDIDKITANNDPYCIKNIEGKVRIVLKKNFNEDPVMIS